MDYDKENEILMKKAWFEELITKRMRITVAYENGLINNNEYREELYDIEKSFDRLF